VLIKVHPFRVLLNIDRLSEVTSRIASCTWVRVRDLGRGPVLLSDLLTVFGRMVRWATMTTCLPLQVVQGVARNLEKIFESSLDKVMI
jgi:hypothetical protein